MQLRGNSLRVTEVAAWAPINFGNDVQALAAEARGGRLFDYRRYQRLMYDVITLALQTDSIRVISYYARRDLSDGAYCCGFMGCPYNYHEMTHHGEEADKLRWLTRGDTWYMEDWAYFIEKLKNVREGDGTLLDHTLLVWGSSGGAVNAHNNTDLPTMLVGGHKLGVKHQGHIWQRDVRLGNLWQTMFGFLGVPAPISSREAKPTATSGQWCDVRLLVPSPMTDAVPEGRPLERFAVGSPRML